MEVFFDVVVEGVTFSVHYAFGSTKITESGIVIQFKDLQLLEKPEFRQALKDAAILAMARLLPESFSTGQSVGLPPSKRNAK